MPKIKKCNPHTQSTTDLYLSKQGRICWNPMYDSLEINVLFPIIISDKSWTVLMLLTETGYEIE